MTLHGYKAIFTPAEKPFSNWFIVPNDSITIIEVGNSVLVVDVEEAKRLLATSVTNTYITGRQWIDELFQNAAAGASGTIDQNAINNVKADSEVPAIVLELPPQIAKKFEAPEGYSPSVIIDGFKRLAKIHASGLYWTSATVIPASVSSLILLAYGIDDSFVFRNDIFDKLEIEAQKHGIELTNEQEIFRLLDLIAEKNPNRFMETIIKIT